MDTSFSTVVGWIIILFIGGLWYRIIQNQNQPRAVRAASRSRSPSPALEFITISFEDRRVLFPKPDRLADLLSMAKSIFDIDTNEMSLHLEFADWKGDKALAELHQLSYPILKDGDNTVLIVDSKGDKLEGGKNEREALEAALREAEEAARRAHALLGREWPMN